MTFGSGNGKKEVNILFEAGMKISDISVNISLIYPISVIFDTISTMTDIS